MEQTYEKGTTICFGGDVLESQLQVDWKLAKKNYKIVQRIEQEEEAHRKDNDKYRIEQEKIKQKHIILKENYSKLDISIKFQTYIRYKEDGKSDEFIVAKNKIRNGLTTEQLEEALMLRKSGVKYKVLTKKYGVSPTYFGDKKGFNSYVDISKISTEECIEIFKLYDSDKKIGWKHLVNKYGVSKSYFSRRYKQYKEGTLIK